MTYNLIIIALLLCAIAVQIAILRKTVTKAPEVALPPLPKVSPQALSVAFGFMLAREHRDASSQLADLIVKTVQEELRKGLE